MPSHQQIEAILLSKIDLLYENQIPQSYFDFLKHIKVNRSYLKTGFGVSYFEKNTPYPIRFDADILGTYEKKRKEYLDLLQSVQIGAQFEWPEPPPGKSPRLQYPTRTLATI